MVILLQHNVRILGQNDNFMKNKQYIYTLSILCLLQLNCNYERIDDLTASTDCAETGTPKAAFIFNNDNCSYPCVIQFTNLSNNACFYTWNFGDGTVGSVKEDAEHGYVNSGSFEVKLIASNGIKSQNDTTTLTVQINGTSSQLEDNDLQLVWVEGGEFEMGCNESACNTENSDCAASGTDCQCLDSECPKHLVRIDGFFIGKFEITNDQFYKFLNSLSPWNPRLYISQDETCLRTSPFKIDAVSEYNSLEPVICLTYEGAKSYSNWLTQNVSLNGALPTEAQWEFAARGGNERKGYLYAGSDNIDLVANYNVDENTELSNVGLRGANELGIRDMTGNVWELCEDYYDRNYYNFGEANNPVNSTANSNGRVIRGGSIDSPPKFCRVSNRFWDEPTVTNQNFGFRVVLNPR